MNNSRKFFVVITLLLAVNAFFLFLLVTNRGGSDGRNVKERETRAANPRETPQAVVAQTAQAVKQFHEQRREKVRARRFVEDPEGKIEAMVNSILTELESATDAETKLKLLAPLAENPHPSVVKVADWLMKDTNPVVRAAALDLLKGYTSPDLIPVAEKALSDPEALVRLMGSRLLTTAEPEQPEKILPALEKAIADQNEKVREVAETAIEEQPYLVRLQAIESALLTDHADVVEFGAAQLEKLSNHDALEALFTGLDNADPDLRDTVNRSIYFLVSHRFPSTAEAEAWWAENKSRYDAKLFEVPASRMQANAANPAEPGE